MPVNFAQAIQIPLLFFCSDDTNFVKNNKDNWQLKF